MRISVAMCTYNGGKFIAAQLGSIAAQSRPPDELVVCDDCSTDDTVTRLEAFAAEASFPVRVVVNERNLGSTKNFEKAVGLAAGDAIALADQDDVWMRDKLERQQDALRRNRDAPLVFSDAEVVDENLRPLGHTLWKSVGFGHEERRRLERGKSFRVLLKRNVVTGATLMFRAEHRTSVLPIPRPWVHDGWIALILAGLGPLSFVDRPLVHYRQHGRSQIGVGPAGLAAQARASGLIHMTREQLEAADLYGMALEALRRLPPSPALTDAMGLVGRKIEHLRQRAGLPAARPRRARPVLSEVVNLGYFRYSAGWRSVAKDLLGKASELPTSG